MSFSINPLPALLYAVNTNPPYGWQDEFYALKGRLLRCYGVFTKPVTQHIIKDCWDCDGEGIVSAMATCDKCEGSGVYEQVWVLLHEYRWGRYHFLLPVHRCYISSLPTGWPEPTISGYVDKVPSSMSVDAALLLLLFFFPRDFWYFFQEGYTLRTTPIATLQRWHYLWRVGLFSTPWDFFADGFSLWRRAHLSQSSYDTYRFWQILCPQYQEQNVLSASWLGLDDIPF